MQELIFAAAPLYRIIAFVAFAAIVVVSVLIWRRSGGSGRVLGTEILRIGAAAIACITLLQPEWRVERAPDRQPTVAVLWDDSHSMETVDVERREGDETIEVVSRAEYVRELLDERFWAALERDNRVTVEAFDTPADPEQPQMSGTDINSALHAALDREDALRAVVLLSDGDWNVGEDPVEAAARAWGRRVPIFPVPVGSPRALPDLALIEASAPAFGIAGDQVQIGFTVRNTMPEAIETTLEVTDGSGRRVTRPISIPALGELRDSVFWTPAEEGINTVTLNVEPVPGEAILDNNERTIQIQARQELIRVLVVDTLPRWEYRFIRNALSRDPGVELKCLLLHPEDEVRGGGADYLDAFPEDEGELSSFDVVFLGDVGIGPGQLTLEQARMLRALVEEQASGLVFIPGREGHQNTLFDSPLGDLIPVIPDPVRGAGSESPASSALVLTESGRRNLLTMLTDDEEENASIWRGLPGFFWSAPVLRARAGSDVLAVHESLTSDYGRLPLLVTATAGTGKVLFLGTDAAWRWRKGVEDLYHYRFWGQVARWMSYQRKMAEGERIRLFYAPENPVAGVTLTVNVNVFDDFGVPLRDSGVLLDVTTPDERTRRLEMTPSASGAFSTALAVVQPGEHSLTATSQQTGDSVATSFFVQGEPLERIGQPANYDSLAEIARITRGALADPNDIAGLISRIASLDAQAPVVHVVRLWSHWMWGAVALLLLTAFWVARKGIGAV